MKINIVELKAIPISSTINLATKEATESHHY